MNTTTEKLLEMFERDTDDELVTDVETLKKMSYHEDTIEALLIYNLELRLRTQYYKNQVDMIKEIVEGE